MSKIERFEDLIAWQKARALAKSIHEVISAGPFCRDFAFKNQIWGAALSVPSNIAEGFERFSHGEFAHFLGIAKASCAEVRSDLYVALDAGYIDAAAMDTLLKQAKACGEVIGRLRAAVEARNPNRKPRTTQHAARSTRGAV